MSSKNNKRTLSGTSTIACDILDLPSTDTALRVNNNKGSVGQVLKKNDTTNKLEWADEQTITASLPLVMSGNQVGFNTTMGINKVSIITSGGKRELLLGNNTGNDFIKLQENNGLVLCSLLDVGGNLGGAINLTHSSDIKFYTDSGSTLKATITPTGISVPDDTRTFNIGAHNFRIGDIYSDNIIGQDITASGNLTITSSGSIMADLRITGNLQNDGDINLFGNIVGDTQSDITGIKDISTTTLTSSGNINANGNIVGDTSTLITGIDTFESKTTKTKIFKVFSDDALSQVKLAYDGVTDIIQGSSQTDIQGIGNITADTFLFSSVLAFDGSTMLFGAGVAINKDTGIDMKEDAITNAKSITYKDTASNTFAGGSASNKVVFTNCDFTSTTNTQGSINNLSPTFSSLTSNGNTSLCQTSGDLFIGNFNQSNHDRPVSTFMSSIYQRFNVQSDLNGNEAISGRLEYQKNLRIQQRSYHSPYQLSDYFLPNMPSTTCLYDPITKLTGDTNRTPYRVIKLHPQNWTPNEDSTVPDIAIYDPTTYPTTGTSAYGGLMARHSAIIEAWSYFDIPEGLKLKAVFLRVASSTSGASFVSRNVKVFKRHLGQLSTDAKYSVNIVDGNTATSSNTPIFALTSGIDQQDLINEYDNYMAIRCELNNLSYVLMGGYVICEPVDLNNLAYSLDITSGSSHYSNFTITIKDQNYPNTTLASKEFTAKNQTKNFIIGYTYASTRDFIIQFGQSDDAMNYEYPLLCNRCEVNDSTSPTIDDVVSNGLTLIRQSSTISFSQIPA